MKRPGRHLTGYILFTLAAVAISFFAGAAPADTYIIWRLRAPRILLGLITGGGLSLAGVVLQSIMKNPLAEPYVSGTSAGAALGAVTAAFIGVSGLRPLFAFAGGILATSSAYLISSRSTRRDSHTLILAGVTVSSLLSAMVLFFMVMSRESAYSILFFLTGSLQNAGAATNITAGAGLALGLAAAVLFSRELDIMALGDEEAAFLGVDVDRSRTVLLFSAAVTTAGCVSAAGIIGFAGLIVPHIVRGISGASHRWLVPFSVIAGGGFLVLCDAAARSLVAPLEIPVGVVTAFAGAPFFMFLLLRKR